MSYSSRECPITPLPSFDDLGSPERSRGHGPRCQALVVHHDRVVEGVSIHAPGWGATTYFSVVTQLGYRIRFRVTHLGYTYVTRLGDSFGVLSRLLMALFDPEISRIGG
jgi:hypothetical protein